MIFTVPLQAGTVLANVRYRWMALGVEGSALSTGITQPSATFPVFRISATPPTGAEELYVYDNTDATNWNVGGYATAVLEQGPGLVAPGSGISPDLASLKVTCAAYLRRATSEMTVDTVDLFLVAANAARVRAEKMHNFEYSRIVATIVIDGNNGGAFSDAVITSADSDAIVSVKEITALRRLRPNGSYIPLDFTRADIPIERERTELEFSDNLWPTFRYPSDADLRARGTASTVIQRGRKLFIYPGFIDSVDNQVSLTIEGYGWLANYGSIGVVTEPEDFMVEFGLDYLKWAIICELNKMFGTFVPRQEGNLPEPVKERDDAFRELVIWDSYQVDSNITRPR
jgi:hypothetical protein